MKKFEMQKINGDALREALLKRHKTLTEACNAIYKSDGYFSEILRRGTMDKGDYILMKLLFAQKGYPFTEEELEAIEMREEVKHDYQFGFMFRKTDDGREQVVVKFYEDGKEIAWGYSTLRGNSRLEYASSMAWATRCMWKAVEEDELNKKGGK